MPEQTPIECHVDVEADGDTAVALLSEALDLSKARIKHAMDCGAVWLTRGAGTQRLRRAKRGLRAGDRLHIYYDTVVLNAVAPAPILVADAGGYTVWDKPCGRFSQGSRWGDHCTVTRYAEKHLEPERNAFVVHRLDRAASGLIVIAHSKRVAARLAQLFRERAINKRYRVFAHGRVAGIDEFLTLDAPVDGKPARTSINVLAYDAAADVTELDVDIETGRKHQIRRHLAGLGHHVVGDRLYGDGNSGADLRLRAYSLAFDCPVSGAPVSYAISPYPDVAGAVG